MQRFERELEIEDRNEDFKSQIFASNPDLYNDLFGEDNDQPGYLGDDQVVFPEDEAEFRAMVSSMMRTESLPPRSAQQEADQAQDRT